MRRDCNGKNLVRYINQVKQFSIEQAIANDICVGCGNDVIQIFAKALAEKIKENPVFKCGTIVSEELEQY